MKSAILTGVAMLCPLASWAAGTQPRDIKPGLWEV
jgi:hypothetical protein